MNLPLLLSLLFFSVLSYSQVIFTPKSAIIDTDSLYLAPRITVTFMGRSISEADTVRYFYIKADQKLSEQIKTDTLLSLEESLFELSLVDSLREVKGLLSFLRKGSRVDKHDLLRAIPSILPIRIESWSAFRVSSPFGLRYHPITEKLHNHSGIDLPQPMYTPVYATADGIVNRIVYQPAGLGLAIYLRHESGYVTVYGHLVDHGVQVGEFIERGQQIARVGSSGISTGPHLHYSVLERGLPVDPADFCFLLLNEMNKTSSSRQLSPKR